MAGAVMCSASFFAAAPVSAAVPAYTCAAPTVYPVDVPGDIGGVATGDLNGDGRPDIVAADLAGTASVFLNNGDGTFAPGVDYALGRSASAADGAGSPVLADLNHDGKLDLVTANYFGNSVSILLGNGDGTFAPAVTYPIDGEPERVVAGNFTGVGHTDLVVLTFSATSPGSTAWLLVGRGDGTFLHPRPIAVPSNAINIVAADFNRDGIADLATANNNNNVATYSASVLLDNGHGRFALPVTYPVGQGPVSVAAGDLNGDSFPDIVTANGLDSTFSVLLNKGDGSGMFNSATSYLGSGGQEDSITADVNADGSPDIAAANPWGNNIMVLLNQGDGSFGAPINCSNVPVGSDVRGPIFLAAADFNNDGKADLVTANLSGFSNNATPSISVLLTP
jgi:hypothetical protein